MRSQLGVSFLLVGAFVLMQGCTTPLVDVKVTTCDGETMVDTGKGICNVYPVGGAPYTGSAYGFIRTDNNQPYAANDNCSGGKKCAAVSGRCDAGPKSGYPCVSWVNPSNMQCSCACPPN